MATDRLYEREQQLSAIDSLLASAREGAGGLVVVQGEAGAGKSSLLAAAREHAGDMTVLRAAGSELEDEFSFGVVLQLFAASAREEAAFDGAAALAAPIFAAEPGGAIRGGDPFPLFHGLHWLASNLAEDAPLALLVDDGHWSDVMSLRFLDYLEQRVEELPIAVVVAARPVAEDPRAALLARLGGHRAASTVRVGPLSENAVAALAEQQLGDEATPELCARCAAATGGNPFHLRAMLDRLRAGEDAAPSTVVARVIALGGGAHHLAEALAAAGDETPLRQLGALAGMDADAVTTTVDALASAGVLRSGLPPAFSHPLVRDEVYAAIPAARRTALHQRAARALHDDGEDAERVGAQIVAAAEPPDGWASDVLRVAARAARARGAPEAAIRYLRLAVQAPGDGEAETWTRLADLEARTGEEGAAERVSAALERVPAGEERARAALRLGIALCARRAWR
jgi:predicted ATPase